MIDRGSIDGPLLEARDLVRVFTDGDVHALRGVSVSVSKGDWVSITGPSGCGKSTLLHLLGGLDRSTSGEVFFEGKSLSNLDLDAFRALELGFVFQSFHLLPTLTALENVQIPMFESPRSRGQRKSHALRLLDEVGMAHRSTHPPSRLSVGERQRVAIARSLANDPRLLLADEPTGNLDSRSQAEILELLGRLRADRGLTLVVVTHSEEVASAGDRIVAMKDGKIA